MDTLVANSILTFARKDLNNIELIPNRYYSINGNDYYLARVDMTTVQFISTYKIPVSISCGEIFG